MTGTASKYQIRDTKNAKRNQGTGDDREQKLIKQQNLIAETCQSKSSLRSPVEKMEWDQMMCGARHMKYSTNHLTLMRGGMRRNGVYQIGPSRERLRRFFALRKVLTGPKNSGAA